jgi:hypothetical protein
MIRRWNALDNGDKAFFVGSLIAPIMVWWYFTGRKKYGTKGLK